MTPATRAAPLSGAGACPSCCFWEPPRELSGGGGDGAEASLDAACEPVDDEVYDAPSDDEDAVDGDGADIALGWGA